MYTDPGFMNGIAAERKRQASPPPVTVQVYIQTQFVQDDLAEPKSVAGKNTTSMSKTQRAVQALELQIGAQAS